MPLERIELLLVVRTAELLLLGLLERVTLVEVLLLGVVAVLLVVVVVLLVVVVVLRLGEVALLRVAVVRVAVPAVVRVVVDVRVLPLTPSGRRVVELVLTVVLPYVRSPLLAVFTLVAEPLLPVPAARIEVRRSASSPRAFTIPRDALRVANERSG